MFDAVGGVTNAYRLLLGDDVIDSMTEKIGKDNANQFLKFHAKYDALVRKNPKFDPMQAMKANDIPVFQDFDSYVRFLKSLERQLSIMREPVSKAMYEVIKAMLKLSEARVPEKLKDDSAEASTTTATAGLGSGVRYGKTIFRSHNLPRVPVQMRNVQELPYSYPSWDATLEVVSKYAEEKNYHTRINSELTDALKSSLVKVLGELPKTQHTTIPELVVEAQEYLMDHNWIQYGIENVAQASYNIACAGVKHQVSVNGVIKHIASTRTLAYAFLGGALEQVLRRGCYAITKDISANMVFAGRSASLDVLSACASYYVQEIGRNWLDNVQSKIK